jgi:hypothetical protein
MIRPQSPSLRLQLLEDRATPAVFGEPWLDGRHLTLSFAPDGTLISGVGSSLGTAVSPLGSEAARLEMLRAFQTWAANANLNIGLAGDNGAAFGAAGAIQGDSRFGDIRIGARVLGTDVIAITSPFSLLTTNAGDFILNAGKSFTFPGTTGTYDLYTVALQEAGHAYGLGNSLDPLSVMFEGYTTPRTGPTTQDIGSLWALYGARTGDAFEGTAGNGTLATASAFTAGLEADLTTAQDVDVFQYTADSSAARWFRIRAAGLSLVSAKLEVLDAAGEVIGSAQAAGPLQNDVTVYVPGLIPGATYYLRVSSARSDVFGVGSYRLTADATAAGPTAADPLAPVDSETLANNSALTAQTVASSTGPYDYSFRSTLKTWTDVDYFRIRSPGTNYQHLTVTVAGVGKAGLMPDVNVYTAAGVRLNAQVVAQTDGSVVVSLNGVTANTDYLIRVNSNLGATGNYDVVADFRAADLPTMMGARGTLDNARRSTAGTMNVWQSQTIQVNLLTNLQNGTDFIGLVRIYDYLNRVKFELFSLTGLLSTGHVFLPRGSYRVEARNLTGAAIAFSLTMFGITDPEGTPSTDPSTDPTGGGNDPPPPPPPPPPPDGGTVGIDPSGTVTTPPDPGTGAIVTTTTTYNAADMTETTTVTTTITDSVTGTTQTTTSTMTLQTDIVWF